jgi:hypothetical protein
MVDMGLNILSPEWGNLSPEWGACIDSALDSCDRAKAEIRSAKKLLKETR